MYIPMTSPLSMYTLCTHRSPKNVPGPPIYYMYPSLFGDVIPCKKTCETHNKEFKEVAFAPFQASEIQQCLSLCLENRVETNAESHAIDSWKGMNLGVCL